MSYDDEDEIIDPLMQTGAKVTVPARPDWGSGVVRKVLAERRGSDVIHRVTVQFTHGTRTLVIPPAKLAAPSDEPTRSAGWIETLGGRTLDDRLRDVPESAAKVLGSPRDKFTALLALYRWDATPQLLEKWARAQTGVADPLSHWSRDELEIAFEKYAAERDSLLRTAGALLKQAEGPAGLAESLNAAPPENRERVREALRRVI